MASRSISSRHRSYEQSHAILRYPGLSVTAVLLVLPFLNYHVTPLLEAVIRSVAVEHKMSDVFCVLVFVAAISYGLLSGKGTSGENGLSHPKFEFIIDTKLSTLAGKFVDPWTDDGSEYVRGALTTSEHEQAGSRHSASVEQVPEKSGDDCASPASGESGKKSSASERGKEMKGITKSAFKQSSTLLPHVQGNFPAGVGIACELCRREKLNDDLLEGYDTSFTNVLIPITAPLSLTPAPCTLNLAVDVVLLDDPEIDSKADKFIARFRDQWERDIYRELQYPPRLGLCL